MTSKHDMKAHITESRRVNIPDKVLHTCGECLGPLTNVRVQLELLVGCKTHIELAGYGDCVKCGDGQDSFGWEKTI